MQCPYCKIRSYETRNELYGHFGRCPSKPSATQPNTAILEFQQDLQDNAVVEEFDDHDYYNCDDGYFFRLCLRS